MKKAQVRHGAPALARTACVSAFVCDPAFDGVAVAVRGKEAVALLQSERQQRPVVFDLSAAKEVDLGSVSRKRE